MRKKHRWLSLILCIIAVLVIAMIVLSLIPGQYPSSSLLAELLGQGAASVTVSELSFEVGRNRNYAHYNGHVAAAGTLGVQVLGPDGAETLRDSFRMTSPAIAGNNGRFLSFDIGGTAVRIFNSTNMLTSIETDGSIVSASINKNGWLCVVTQEQMSGSRGNIDVYNNDGKQVFKVYMGTGYALNAKLSDDNMNLAILSITETGSRITVYNDLETEKSAPDNIFDLGSGIVPDMDYISDTQILAIGINAVYLITLPGNEPVLTLYSFDDRRLGGYTYTSQFIALRLFDYNIGYSGQIVSLGYDGTVLGRFDTSSDIIAIDSYNNTLILLDSGGVSFLDTALELDASAGSISTAATADHILALGDNLALAANDLSAFVIKKQ